jgi:hypothetical protein
VLAASAAAIPARGGLRRAATDAPATEGRRGAPRAQVELRLMRERLFQIVDPQLDAPLDADDQWRAATAGAAAQGGGGGGAGGVAGAGARAGGAAGVACLVCWLAARPRMQLCGPQGLRATRKRVSWQAQGLAFARCLSMVGPCPQVPRVPVAAAAAAAAAAPLRTWTMTSCWRCRPRSSGCAARGPRRAPPGPAAARQGRAQNRRALEAGVAPAAPRDAQEAAMDAVPEAFDEHPGAPPARPAPPPPATAARALGGGGAGARGAGAAGPSGSDPWDELEDAGAGGRAAAAAARTSQPAAGRRRALAGGPSPGLGARRVCLGWGASLCSS